MDVTKTKKKRISLGHCGVPQCNSYKSATISMHQIPKKVLESREELIKWQNALKMEKNFPKKFFICSRHFKDKYLLRPLHLPKKQFKVKLVSGAFPTENLPNVSNQKKFRDDSFTQKRILKQTSANLQSFCSRKDRKVLLEEPTEYVDDNLPNQNCHPMLAFEYVEIKSNSVITNDNPMSSNSAINFPKPLFELKIEPEDNSSSPSLIPLSNPSQNRSNMVDQACQTEGLYVPTKTEACKDQLIAILKRENEQLKKRLTAIQSNHQDQLIAILKRENEQLKERLMARPSDQSFSKLSIASLKGQNKKVNFLTGLPNFGILEMIYKDVANYVPSFDEKISKFDVFLMTWIKLELDLSLNLISVLMNIKCSEVLRLFYETFVILHNRLNGYIIWPDDTQYRLGTPNCYKQIFGEGRFIIIDFFEIFTEPISSTQNNLPTTSVQTSSKSKPLSMKYLISFSTDGTIIYLSKPFKATLNNNCIIKQSGFLSKIDTDYIILANRKCLSVNKSQEKYLVPMVKTIKGELAEITFEVTTEFIKIREDITKKILFAERQIVLQTNRPPILAVMNKYGQEMFSEFVIKLACSVVNLMILNTDHVVAEERNESDSHNNKII